jgi:hypothetical protein
MTPAAAALDVAAGRLHAASDRADQLGTQLSSPDLLGLAGQIRLIANGLSLSPNHGPDHRPGDGPASSVVGELRAALDALDRISPADGPPDLQVWAWHVSELLRLAREAEAS